VRNRERIFVAELRAAQPLGRLLAPLHAKGVAALAGRSAAEVRFREWGRTERDVGRPLVLLHAPSVGEALMAQAILERIRRHRSDAQLAFTFFSPSAERIASQVGADVSGYLPLDARDRMHAFVQELRPTVVAFVRTEIWPMLGLEAAAAGARVALINAVLGPSSSRLRPHARFLLGPAYRRLNAIGAVHADDAQRFGRFGVPPHRVSVTGDARFDQVWQRVQSIDPNLPLLRVLRANSAASSRPNADARRAIRPLLVAGSTWPVDERLILQALADMTPLQRPRAILAPHEPGAAQLAHLEQNIHALGMTHVRLSTFEAAPSNHAAADILIVDRVGVLADLYAAADVAYVGGGFGTRGLHSVIEPAALGVPVLYGPRVGNAREAEELADNGGGFTVYHASDLCRRIRGLSADAAVRERAGAAARRWVQSRLGGAEANAGLVVGLIAPMS
jgi:3-deoxy-D-manno-octulosonic-acid transferase